MAFRKYKKRCPRCGSMNVRVFFLNPVNIVLMPVNYILGKFKTGTMFFMNCTDCGRHYDEKYRSK